MRPAVLNPLFAEVSALKGVGSAQVRQLARLKIARALDLAFHLPTMMIDRLAVYAEAGLRALITDVSANDGKLIPPYGSPRRRQHMHYQMDLLRARVLAGELPTVGGVIPVVVTFHDPNPFTAEHLAEYLGLLVSSAQRHGLRVSEQPFYGQADDVEAVALARTVAVGDPVQRIPGFWHSLLLMKP